MKTLTPLLLLLLTLVVCGGRCSDEEAASHDISTSTPDTSTSVARGEEAKLKEKAEREGQVEGQDVEALEGGDDEGDAPSSEAVKKSLAAARLPRPEALQGGRRGRSRQGSSLGTPQVLPGLHLGRIPPSCALCSRERNLCRIISGIFTRSPLPYGYSLVTPVPAGVCNLTITEMKPSKNFFALRRSDGTYVLNGNWNIQAAGEYPAAGTTFFYTPSDEDHGEQLSSPGPLKEPIDFMLISQSPNHGVKYEYRVPLPEYLGGNTGGLGPPSSGLKPPTGGLGLQTGGVRPNIGGSGIGHGVANPNPGQLTPFQPLPQGNPNMNPRNPNFRIRNPNIGGVNPNVPGLFPYGTGGTGGSLGPITPVLTPVTTGGNVGFNTSGVSFPPISTVGADPAGSPRRNPPFPGIPLDPSTSTGSRSSGIPGVPPHGQPITPLGSTTKTTGTLPLPWTPTYGSQEGGGRGVPLGTPFVPGQQYPRTSGGGGGGGTPVQRYPGQVRPDGTGHDGSSHDSGGGSMGLTPSRDTGLLPEFPKNSVPLRTIPIPQPGTPRGRRPPADVPSHHRYPITGETISTTPADTHRTRHQHGSKLGQGRRKGNGKPHDPVFDSGVQLTQPNATPSFSSSNRTVPVSTLGRRGKGGGRRHEKHEGAGTVLAGGGKRHRKGRRGRHRKQGPRFQWAEKGFTPCSRSCGGGNKTVILSCERRRNKKVVSDRRCSHLPRPEKRPAMCNLTPCPATWLPGDWGPCSVTCGMGVQTRPLMCKQVVSPTLTMMVAEGACLSPPTVPTSQVCEMSRCSSTTPEWEAEPWGNCSAPCGLGTRMRQVRCLVAGMPASEEPCDDDTKPQQEQVCDMGSCAINTWFFSKWAEECSESCGTGVQTRHVHCLAGGSDMHDQCPASSRPDVSRPCRGESGCGGQWFAGPWSGCSVDCGTGRDSRPVLCVVFNRERWRVSHDANCKLEARPHDSRECNPQPCTPAWYTSEWSQCSASCDGGVRRREVTCLDASQRPSADCFNASKPDTRQPCHLHPCGLQPSTAPPTDAASNRTHTGDTGAATSSQDLEGTDDTYNADDVTEDPEVDGATEDEVSERADEVGVTDDERPAQEEEEEEEESEGEENELVVEETTGSALNVIPDKDAQGDESVSDDEDEEERDKEDEEEEKKKKKKKKKEKRKNRDKQDKDGSESTEGTRREPSSADTPACIDRIKNCHLVFRARLCRLRYYNKLCCRTCSNT
ncbi:uncharacterized protein [Panulirus ornatus]|uniref:uncharacterized protein n=1 Tax=Panulirus ornatus TaxID=150431 RepID=UPI003A8B58B9